MWWWLLACAPPDVDSTPVARACNGQESWCDRPYDQMVFPATHNAMSNLDDVWVAPNQEHGIEQQLDDGVRVLLLDVHGWEDDVWLCHGDPGAFYTCTLGRRLASDAFAALDAWLADHPDDVLTLILESYVTTAQLEASMGSLTARTRAQPADAPWPTLGELSDAGEQLVVLSDRGGGERPWLLPIWDHTWDTDWSIADPAEFTCARNRGGSDSALFLLNHWVSDPLPVPAQAEVVNQPDYIVTRARGCEAELGRLPTFVAVDFYATGDVVGAAATLTGP